MTAEERGLIKRCNLRFRFDNSDHVKAMERIQGRNRALYETAADYVAAAVAAFHGDIKLCPLTDSELDHFMEMLSGKLEKRREERRYGG